MNMQKALTQPQKKTTVLYTVADGKTTLRATTDGFSIGRASLGFSHDYKGKTQTMQVYPPMTKLLLLTEMIGKKETVGTVLLNEVSYVS